MAASCSRGERCTKPFAWPEGKFFFRGGGGKRKRKLTHCFFFPLSQFPSTISQRRSLRADGRREHSACYKKRAHQSSKALSGVPSRPLQVRDAGDADGLGRQAPRPVGRGCLARVPLPVRKESEDGRRGRMVLVQGDWRRCRRTERPPALLPVSGKCAD